MGDFKWKDGDSGDPDNGNGVWCKASADPECARRNAEGVLVDLWLLSMCDRYVYWRSSGGVLPLLRNATLKAHRVGPPLTDVDPSTDFGGSDEEEFRLEMFEWWRAGAAFQQERENEEYFHPASKPDLVLHECQECEDVLGMYGLRRRASERGRDEF